MKKLILFLAILSVFADDNHSSNEMMIYYKPEEVSNFALPHSILEDHELEKKNNSKSIAETVSTLPGVTQSGFTAGASRPIIRGASGNRIRILENSLGVNDVSDTSDDHAVMSDPIEADEFSILRGPATLFYGSNASGGLIQIKNRAIARTPVEREFAGQLDLRGGTVDNEKTGALKLFGQNDKHNWYISSYSRDTDDYDSPIGKQHNTKSLSQGLTLADSYIWNSGFFGVSFSHKSARYGIPEGVHQHAEEDHDHEDEHGHEEEGIYLDPQMNQIDLVYHQDNPFDYFDSVETSYRGSWYKHNENEAGMIATTYKNDSHELRVDLAQKKYKNLSGGIGVNFRNTDFNAAGEEAFIPSSKTFATGIYGFEELNFESYLFQFGANQEFQNVSSDQDYNFNLSSVSSGIIIPIKKQYAVNFTTTYSERAPSTSELLSNGLHLARNSYEIGDADLPEEASVNYEIGLAKKYGRLKSQLNTYFRDYSNYIALKPTGEQKEGAEVYKYESVPAHFYGFEFSNKLNIFESNYGKLDLTVSTDFIRAIDLDEDKELPRTPPVKTIYGLDYDLNRLHIGLQNIINSSQDNLANNETRTYANHLLNATVGYYLDPSEKISLFLDGNNLTDEEVRLHTSFTKDALVLAGRNVLLGLRVKF